MQQGQPRPGLLNWLLYGVGRLVQIISGWSIPGALPDEPKYIIIAVHTSQWDMVWALMGMLVLSHGLAGLHLRWMGKQELFGPGLGWFMRAIGGIPIDRSSSQGVVEQSIAAFGRHERMALIITPEGTRKRGRGWKTGFYYIALGAHVPILCGILDYRRKVVGPGLLLWPTGDIEADMQRIRGNFEGQTALYPGDVADITITKTDEPQNPGDDRMAA